MPTARNLSRREPGSGNGVEVDGGGAGALNEGVALCGGERIGATDCGGCGCGVVDCLASNAASAAGPPRRELKEGC